MVILTTANHQVPTLTAMAEELLPHPKLFSKIAILRATRRAAAVRQQAERSADANSSIIMALTNQHI
jgi:hypothetical protein